MWIRDTRKGSSISHVSLSIACEMRKARKWMRIDTKPNYQYGECGRRNKRDIESPGRRE
jgi:hypothetical protein